MGQRLPSLPTDWANLVAQGDSKRYEGAAAIRAQGTDAMTRGIQQGIAGITAGILRKKETAKADKRWEAQFALQKDKAQFDKDVSIAHMIQTKIQQLRAQRAATTGVPDQTTGQMLGGDPQGAARIDQEIATEMGHLDVVTRRAIASSLAESLRPP